VDPDELVARCVEAIADGDPRLAVRSVLERAVSDRHLADTVGARGTGLNALYNTAELTVLNVVWPPLVSLFPHEHRMWAAIGIYGGREDNAFYRRDGDTIVPSGGKALDEGDVLLLGDDAIHSVHNPARVHTGAIHVYGGDFFATPRSQWDAETLAEEPYDIADVQAEFQRAEREFRASQA